MAHVLTAFRPSRPTPSLVFNESRGCDVSLIEVFGDGRSNRYVVDKELVETYILNDYSEYMSHVVRPEPSAMGRDGIKLFYSKRWGEYVGDMIPIFMPGDMFKTIAPYARIPDMYIHILSNKTPVNVFTTPQLPPHLSHLSAKLIKDEYLSFVIQSVPGAVDGVCIGASFTYHFKTQQMYIFMHGLQSSNYHHFTQTIKCGAASASSLLIPYLLIQFNLERRLKALNTWQDKIYWYERRIGIRWDHHDNPSLDDIDFTSLSKDLNAANTNLKYMVWGCKTTTRQLDFLDVVVKRYKKQARDNGIMEETVEEVVEILKDENAYLREWNTGLEDRADYLAERGKALVQTVYSGIAQRDSASSLSLAAMSTEVAKLSQDIAVSTSRDSAVMRIIAAITIFFLPATFTATFFSTTFFDFNVGRNERVYSWWLWLYFVVTILLTAVVVVGTWILWRRKEDEIARKLRKSKDS